MKACTPLILNAISLCVVCLLSSCVDQSSAAKDSARPSLKERIRESNGFVQDSEGNWGPKSDRRSSYDSQRNSPYSKDEIDKKDYKTGDYAKKSWWGSKSYEAKEYQGNTDGSRFRKDAAQNGQMADVNGERARLEDPYETNTLEYQKARQTDAKRFDHPTNSYAESQQRTYTAPSVIDWKEQRSMSIDKSRGILGR